MDFSKLAQALGLPKDSPQDKISTAAAKALAEGVGAKESLSRLEGELGKYGLKLDQGTIVKIEAGPASEALAIKDTDDAEARAWKTELAERRKKDQLDRIKAIGTALSARVASLQLPPDSKEVFERVLCAIPPKATVLALSSKGDEVVSTVSESLQAEFLKALESFPKMGMPAEGLSRLSGDPLIPPSEKPKTDAEALAQRGREAAARRSRQSKTFKEKSAAGKK